MKMKYVKSGIIERKNATLEKPDLKCFNFIEQCKHQLGDMTIKIPTKQILGKNFKKPHSLLFIKLYKKYVFKSKFFKKEKILIGINLSMFCLFN